MSSTASMAGHDFAYGYGRVGVLQQQMLSKEDIDRMVGSHSDAELRQILTETKFTSAAMPLEKLEEFVPAMEKQLKKDLHMLVPEGREEVFNILWLREDMSIVAHLLKEYHGQTSGGLNAALHGATAYDYAHFRAQIFESGHRELPEDVAHFIEEMKSRKNIRPDQIDHDTAVFFTNMQLRLAEASGSRLILRYVRHLVDLQNIRTARRLRPGEDPEQYLLPGGEINPRRISTDPRELAVLVQGTSLPTSVSDGLRGDGNASLALERGLAKGLAHDIAEMRSVPLSIEPIFAYGVMALSQILLVRTVLIGKAAGLQASEIRDILPPVFSTSVANA